jgi:hypothetical protein
VPTYPTSFQTMLDREPERPAGIHTAEIDYDADGTPCRGFLATPVGVTSAPGVLVVHEWTGVGEYVQLRCEMLAHSPETSTVLVSGRARPKRRGWRAASIGIRRCSAPG